MTTKRLGLFLVALLCLSASAHAQTNNAVVVQTCGTLPKTYAVGNPQPMTQDVNGNQCSSATLSGSVSIGTVGQGAKGTDAAADSWYVQPGTGAVFPISGSINNTTFIANAGTNLNTSALALESGGNLATLGGGVIAGVYQSNTKQVNGVTVLTGAGAVGTGSERIAIGQDITTIGGSAPGVAGTASANVLSVQGIAGMTKLLVTPDSVALPANQSVNVSQINGITPLMGNGVTGTGSQRVTVASDNTPFSIKIDQTTDGTTNAVHLKAGTAIAGQFGIDQTTVGTTNAIAIGQIGANAASSGAGVVGTGSLRVAVGQDVTTISGSAPGTAGSASANVVSVQGIASMTPVAVTCSSGCSGVSFVDEAAFTQGSSSFSAVGGLYTTSVTNLTTGQVGVMRSTNTRHLMTDIEDFGGAAVSLGQKVMSSSMPVTLASDQSKILVTPDSVALPDNQSVNVSQINGVTPLMGNGVTGTGSQRVTIASDNTSFNIKLDQTTPGTTNGISQNAAQAVSVTLQNAATGNGNGTVLTTTGESAAMLTVNCSSCSGGTTVFFEITEDGTNYAAQNAVQVGTTTIASSTTTLGITVWELPVGGSQNIRARVGAYSAGTITVTGHTVPVAYAPKIVKAAIDQTTPGTTNAVSLAQIGAVTVSTGAGVTGTGTQRVGIAQDTATIGGSAPGTAGSASTNVLTVQGIASMTKLLVTPDSVALPANQSVNVNQLAGTTTDTNSGTKSAGTLRVVLATDQPQLTNKLLVTPDSVALPANQSVNVSQINAVTPLMGNGVTGTGSQRVTIASDNTPFPTKIDQTTPGTTNGVSQNAAQAVTVTLQNAAVASGNGTVLTTTGESEAMLTVNCSSCSGGTTVNFEISEDGTNYVSQFANQLGTNTIASSTTTSGITVWELPVAGATNIRARISGYSAGTVTVTGHTVPMHYTSKMTSVAGIGTAGSASGGVLTVQGVASMTKLLVTPDSVALPANQSTNVAQVAGTTTDTNSGNKSAGTIRVVLATDQPALSNKLLVTPDSVALPANQSVNLAQVAGTNTVNGGVAGSQSIGGTVATNVAITANPVNLGAQAVSSENAAVTTARQVQLVAGLVGKLIVLPYANPENFVSGVITTAMTGTTTTSLIAAPASGLRNYITQITCSNAHATVGTDIIIQDGSGGTTLYNIPAAAAYGGSAITFPTPLRQPTTATAIFVANVTTGASTKCAASGYKGA